MDIPGIAIGVLAGAAITWFFYARAKRDPQVVYFVRGATVVDGGNTDLIEVRYEGAIVPRVTTTEVTFWNRGRGTLRPEHVPPLDSLRAVLPHDADLLAVNVTSTSRANEAEVETGSRTAHLTFRYLDPGEDICLTLTHTGSDPLGVDVGGTVTEAGKVQPRGLEIGPASSLPPLLIGLGIVGFLIYYADRVESSWGRGLIVAAALLGLALSIFGPLITERLHRRSLPERLRAEPTRGRKRQQDK